MVDKKEEVSVDFERVVGLIHVIEKCKYYNNYMDLVRSAERELANIDADCKEQLAEIVDRERQALLDAERDRHEERKRVAQESADAGYQPTAPVTLPNPAIAEPAPGKVTPLAVPTDTSAPAPQQPGPAVPGANETGKPENLGGTAEPDLPPPGSSSPPPSPGANQPQGGMPAEPVPAPAPSPDVPPVTTAQTSAETPNVGTDPKPEAAVAPARRAV